MVFKKIVTYFVTQKNNQITTSFIIILCGCKCTNNFHATTIGNYKPQKKRTWQPPERSGRTGNHRHRNRRTGTKKQHRNHRNGQPPTPEQARKSSIETTNIRTMAAVTVEAHRQPSATVRLKKQHRNHRNRQPPTPEQARKSSRYTSTDTSKKDMATIKTQITGNRWQR